MSIIKYKDKINITLHDHTYKDCEVGLTFYPNNQPALVILNDGKVICKASVNLPGKDLPTGYIYIKNWSENEGILQELIKANIIEDTSKVVFCGYTHANICKLLGNIISKEEEK